MSRISWILYYKQQKRNLSQLSSDEWIELGKLEQELERVCKKIFGATMYNFACLMNNVYRDLETPHVHFHFIKIKLYL